ncbi:plasmid stabilization system (plasmid) [Gemmatirosa kalamazoonensis]|uniref:Plasmid stabilization system n=1 Tax=Gemmatirosa kalamazoonensis TaxID=861299 RepID=W0RPE4_9BACT|nr:plasmid stabilization system [Gemmatirosa kalamazoonensis]
MSPRRRLVFRPGARAEIREARGWYEARVAGLGRRFLADLDATMTHIVERPEMYQAIADSSGDRRALLRRFPYSVVYRVTSAEIVVLACLHHRQDLDAWRPPAR